MKRITQILFLLLSAVTFAQTGSVSGSITDKDFNDEPLSFANVLIKGTTKGASSDIDGNYIIEDLEAGTHKIEFSFMGYETKVFTVIVKAGQDTKQSASLGADAAVMDEVVIKASSTKETESALLLDTKKAVEIKQSIGAAELSRKGVSNAAGAVAKISGVSKQEGSSNVYVRGLGDRYLNTTMNGLPLPSNDVDKKNISLSLFSSDVIQNVSISKAYGSKFYADFAAGNVDITSKDFTGKGFFNFGMGTGINTNAVNKDFVRSEGTGYFGYYGRYDHNPFAVVLSHGVDPVSSGPAVNVSYGGSTGETFNFENGSRLSLFATASFDNDYAYREGQAIDFGLVEKKGFDAAEEFEYTTKTTALANVNYKIDDSSVLKFSSLFVNSSSDVVGYFGTDGNGRNFNAKDVFKGFYQMNVQFEQTKMYVNQLTGKHKFDDIVVDWGIGYNRVFSHQPDRKRLSLEEYDKAFDDDPTTNPVLFTNGVFDNQRYFQNIEDTEYSGRLNLAYAVDENVKLNFGYNGRSKARDFNNSRFGYNVRNTSYQVLNKDNFNEIFNFGNLNISETQTGLYDIKVIRPFEEGASTTNRPGALENTYNGRLGVFAGYVNAEITFGEDDKWLIVPGVRLESIDQLIDYDVINLGNKGVGSVSFEEQFVLPSVSVKYGLTEDVNLRFSASETLSLPEFKEVAPFVYESISSRIGGNPDVLGVSKVYNFDVKGEWFITPSELLSAGVFTKQINNPINLVLASDATGTLRYFRTGNKATVLGAEVEVKKNLLLNDDDSPKLAFGANATYMKTEQDLYASIDGTVDVSFEKTTVELQGASPLIVNGDISYSPQFENYQPTLNLIGSYFSDRIDALGSGRLGNIIEKSIFSLDFVMKNKIGDKFEINASAKNLLNPKVRYFRESDTGDVLVNSANGKGVTNYRRGIDLGLSVKYKF